MKKLSIKKTVSYIDSTRELIVQILERIEKLKTKDYLELEHYFNLYVQMLSEIAQRLPISISGFNFEIDDIRSDIEQSKKSKTKRPRCFKSAKGHLISDLSALSNTIADHGSTLTK